MTLFQATRNVFSCPAVQDIVCQSHVTENPVPVNKLVLVLALKLVTEEFMNWGEWHHTRVSGSTWGGGSSFNACTSLVPTQSLPEEWQCGHYRDNSNSRMYLRGWGKGMRCTSKLQLQYVI